MMMLYVLTQPIVGINTNTPNYILEVNSTNAIKIPKGTTTQRPGTVTDGLIRYNSTNKLKDMEIVLGEVWVV